MESAQESGNSTLNRSPETAQEPSPVVVRREAEKDLVVWTAPARPFKRYGRKFYVTVFSIVGIISIILFIAEGAMPVVLLISLVFLFYVLSTVPPENIEYKITNKGIKIAGRETPWQNIVRFCFMTKSGSDMTKSGSDMTKSGSEVLVFDTIFLPGRMEFVIVPEIKESLRREISAYVPYEEIKPSTLDKVVNWIVKKMPESE